MSPGNSKLPIFCIHNLIRDTARGIDSLRYRLFPIFQLCTPFFSGSASEPGENFDRAIMDQEGVVFFPLAPMVRCIRYFPVILELFTQNSGQHLNQNPARFCLVVCCSVKILPYKGTSTGIAATIFGWQQVTDRQYANSWNHFVG